MVTTAITLAGTLQPDGVTLQLERKVALPAGKVTVTVQAAGARSGPTMLEVLDQIHRDQQQRGCKPITEEELAAQIAQMRAEDDEYDERWRHIWSQTGMLLRLPELFENLKREVSEQSAKQHRD